MRRRIFYRLNKSVLLALFFLVAVTACGHQSAGHADIASLTVTANECAGGALENVNVYLLSGNLQYHGHTDAGGSLTLPAVADSMPAGNYKLSVWGPRGMKCYPTAACDTAFAGTIDVPGTLAVYCQ